MSTPSRSVWPGRSSRPQQPGANPAASSSAMPNIPTAANQPVINNGSAMPNIPTIPPQPQAQPQPQTQPQFQPQQQAMSQQSPAMPVSPTRTKRSDDIILPTSSAPKTGLNKKPFIIGGVAAAGVAAILGAIVLISNLQSSAPQGSALGQFNIYANYILYGEEDSTKNLDRDMIYDSATGNKISISTFNKQYDITTEETATDEEEDEDEDEEETTNEEGETITLDQNMLGDIGYNYDEKFKIINVIETYDNDAANAFFENSITRFDAFLQAYNSNQELITNYYNELTFYAFYIKTTDDVDEMTIVEKVQNNSLDDAISFIQNSYAPYKNLENSLAQKYAEESIESYSAWAKIVAWAKDSGCLTDGAINETCTNDVGYTEDIQNEYEKYGELSGDAATIVEEIPQNLVSQCWEISDLLSSAGGNS